MTLFGISFIVAVIKVKTSRRDPLRLEWALNPMVNFLRGDRKGEDTEYRRVPCKDRGRDRSYEATRKAKGCQHFPEASTEAWDRLPLRASERS